MIAPPPVWQIDTAAAKSSDELQAKLEQLAQSKANRMFDMSQVEQRFEVGSAVRHWLRTIATAAQQLLCSRVFRRHAMIHVMNLVVRCRLSEDERVWFFQAWRDATRHEFQSHADLDQMYDRFLLGWLVEHLLHTPVKVIARLPKASTTSESAVDATSIGSKSDSCQSGEVAAAHMHAASLHLPTEVHAASGHMHGGRGTATVTASTPGPTTTKTTTVAVANEEEVVEANMTTNSRTRIISIDQRWLEAINQLPGGRDD